MYKLDEFLNSQTGLKSLILSILDYCRSERTVNSIQVLISSHPSYPSSFYSDIELLSIIIEHDVLQSINNTNTNTADKLWITSDKGIEILDKYSAKKEILHFFKKEKNISDICKSILTFCKQLHSSWDIDDTYSDHPNLKTSGVMTHYCVHELEKIGALQWLGNGWKTTEEGLKII